MNSEAPDRGWRGVVIDDRNAGRRVDVYLSARFPVLSRTAVARHIRDGAVRSEDRALKPSSTLRLGERLRLYVPGLAPDRPPPPLPPVLHEDDRLLVFDKPAGLLTHPTGQRWAWALIGLAREGWPGVRLDLVHRLDRETSGVQVLTKDAEANSVIKKAFLAREVDKTYLALVRGVVPWDQQVCDAPLGSREDSAIRIRQGVRPDGASAVTGFEVVARLAAHTLVAATPKTGRTHQIRVHLEHLGFPVLGDKMYGHDDAVFLRLLDEGPDAVVRAATRFPRHALHASALLLPHPDGGTISLRAPLPPDMAAVVAGEVPAWPEAPPDELEWEQDDADDGG